MLTPSQAIKSFSYSLNSTPNPIFIRTINLVKKYAARHKQRKALAELDERMLRDIAITKEQALHQASKPFWQ